MGYIAFILMVINIVSKILGFFRDVLLSYFYGTGEVATAFQIASIVPYTILGFVIAGFSANFIPMYTGIKNESGRNKADEFTSNVLNIIFIVSIVATIIAYIFAGKIVYFIAMGLSESQFLLAVKFTRITLLGMFVQLLNAILKGYLNIQGNFIIPGSTGLLYNLIIIIFLILSYNINYVLAPVGIAVATVLQYIPYIPSIKRTGYRHKLILDFKDKNIIRLLTLALPIILGLGASQINQLIDKNLASFISPKGISVLSYSVKINEFVWGILIVSIITAIYPTLSKLALVSINKFKIEVSKTISMILYLVTPACFGILIFSSQIVELIYRRGKFDQEDAVLVSGVLFCYGLDLVFLALRDVLSNSFYALKLTKIPLINSLEMVVINVITSVILSRYFGLNGIALGSVIALVFGAVNLFYKFEKQVGKLNKKPIYKNGIKMLISAITMSLVSKLVFIIVNLKLSSNISFLIALIFAVITYAVVSVALRATQALQIARTIINKIGK